MYKTLSYLCMFIRPWMPHVQNTVLLMYVYQAMDATCIKHCLVYVYQAMDATSIKHCLTCVCLSRHGCHMYKTLFYL